MLKLMYITNDPEVALIAERSGVDRIWIDLETLGKEERQKNYNSVKSHHTVEDVRKIAPTLSSAEMLVRVDPWNENSQEQIDSVIDAGAQIVMLPYWKTADEVAHFIKAVGGRCRTMLLLETKEAVECLDEVLQIPGIDEIHIGLNDLHLSYGLTFMFELYSNGVVEQIANKVKAAGIPFGIGGIGKFGTGLLPTPEDIIVEHYRLGSTGVIISRSFCNYQKIGDLWKIEEELSKGIEKLREVEKMCSTYTSDDFFSNKLRLNQNTVEVVRRIEESRASP